MARKSPQEIMREAEALIQQTKQSLASTGEALRAGGVDAERSLDAQQKVESEALFRKDMEEVEREVAEEAARLNFASAVPKSGGARKMRNMI